MTYQSFFDRLNRAFWRCDFEAVASYYVVPLPLYVNQEPNVFTKHTQVVQGLRAYYDALVAGGFQPSTARVVAQSVGTVQTTSVWVEYLTPKLGQSDPSVSNVRYMVTGGRVHPKVALIEYRSSVLGLDRFAAVFGAAAA
ncbi:hypothetical protein [Nereida sp. MMG025]|uniref:hypothetical protein n=1 Tax=Nereida sp. MMG025 TaxID=2909981 RepID=UPI001F1DA6C2|nr:hypothetical protein [Nereida sp. MMG025]MCF6445623.1 hypothetical protein [Nereida sp. MMG025]